MKAVHTLDKNKVAAILLGLMVTAFAVVGVALVAGVALEERQDAAPTTVQVK